MPFEEMPTPGEPLRDDEGADEFARLFGELGNPAPTSASSAPRTPEDVPAAPPGEFTQIFRQIARPTSKAPDLDAAPPAPAPAAAGEFTQFFSSTRAAEAAASLPPRAAAPAPATPPPPIPREHPVSPPANLRPASEPPAQGRAPGMDFAGGKRSSAAPLPFAEGTSPRMPREESFPAFGESAVRQPSPPIAPAREVSASDVTQLFQPESPSLPPARPPSVPPPSPVLPHNGPGEFTRLMQGLGSGGAQPPAPSPVAVPPPAAPSPGPVAQPGEFTRLMQGLQQPSTAPLPPEPPRSAAVANGPGEFTQLMAGLGGPAANTFPEPPPPMGGRSVSPSADLRGGPGEFTRLMQSLNTPGSATPGPLATATPPPVTAPVSMTGESEFTRVMRGSPHREPSAAAVANPAAPAPAASAAPASEMAGKDAEAKPKKWLLILLAVNVLLLLLVILLVILFLHHRH